MTKSDEIKIRELFRKYAKILIEFGDNPWDNRREVLAIDEEDFIRILKQLKKL